MKCFIKLWMRYIYIKSYFILLRQGKSDALIIAQENVNELYFSLTGEWYFHEVQPPSSDK